MKKPLLTIGMIFRDDIRCIERCLKALQPLRDAVPCELIMADTGSADGSREVAERYADVVFDFPWINDFAAARNAVMERAPAAASGISPWIRTNTWSRILSKSSIFYITPKMCTRTSAWW